MPHSRTESLRSVTCGLGLPHSLLALIFRSAALSASLIGCGDVIIVQEARPEDASVAATAQALCGPTACNPVSDFGAVPNDSIADTVAFQQAIDEALATRKPLIVPKGVFILNDTLWIGPRPGVATHSYASFVMKGESGAYISWTPNPTNQLDGTILRMKSSDGARPAINIQGTRDVTISDLIVLGENEAPGLPAAYGYPNSIAADPNAWISNHSVTGKPLSSSQFAPYAGIAIDGYSGSAPMTDAGAYPIDVDAGKTYGKEHSSNLKLENMLVEGFVVGVAVKPSNDSNNAENITFDRVHLHHNTYGLSVGNSQARNVVFQNGAITGSHTMVTTRLFGVGNGQAPILRNVNMGNSYRAFNLTPDVGHITLDGIHMEATAILGDFGEGASGAFSSAELSNSTIVLWMFRNHRPAFLFQTFIPFSFSNVSMGIDACSPNVPGDCEDVLRPFSFFVGGTCAGRTGCNVRFENTTIANYAAGKANNLSYSVIGQTAGQEAMIHAENSALQHNAPNQELNDEAVYETIPPRLFVGPNVHTIRERSTGSAYSVKPLPTRVSTTLIYNAQDPANSATHKVFSRVAGTPQEVFEGDWLYWQTRTTRGLGTARVPALRVASVTATTVTAKLAINDLDPSYNATTTPTQVQVDVLRPTFVNKAPASFSWSAGSTTLQLQNGSTDSFQSFDFVQGTGLAANSRIVALTATSIQLNKAATAAGSNQVVFNTALESKPW